MSNIPQNPTSPSQTIPPVKLTEAALRRIALILAKENKPDLRVRLEVLGGGCSGFQYRFGFDDKFVPDEDILIELNQARFVVDTTSAQILNGSEIDYSESLMESGFKVNNPNAKSSCGCGTSFSL